MESFYAILGGVVLLIDAFFWRYVMQNMHIRTLIHFLLNIFCIGVKIYLTLKNSRSRVGYVRAAS